MVEYAVHDSDGELVSIGTVLADPMPDGLTALELTTEQSDRRTAGWRWTPGTLSFDVEPAEPEPDDSDRITELEAIIAALLGEEP